MLQISRVKVINFNYNYVQRKVPPLM